MVVCRPNVDPIGQIARMIDMESRLNERARGLTADAKQKISLGRGMVREDVAAILFDEPLTVIDPHMKWELRTQLKQLHREFGHTMIYVTHDQTEAMTLADKIVVLRAGIVEQYGSPLELYDDPDNEFVAGFIGSPRMNFLEAEVTGAKKGSAKVNVPALGDLKIDVATRDRTPEKGEKVQVGIRPEHFISAEGAKHKFKAPTSVVEQLGGNSYLYLNIGGSIPLTVEQKGHATVQDGQVASVGVDPTTAMLFGTDGLRI